MNRKKTLRFAIFFAAFALASCSGPKPGTVPPGGGGSGNASVSVSISDTPPANTAIMSFTLPIFGITLTPSGGGSPVPVFSSSTAVGYELTRLQSDSDLITTNVSVAAGTYSAINVTVSASNAVFFNGSTGTIGTCTSNSICSLPQGSPGTITYTFPANSPLVLTANQSQWLDLDFNYNNAIVTTTGIRIDVTQLGVLTALTTPLAGIPTGAFANVDDFTGIVTALSPSSITIDSTARGSLTAIINSSTIAINDPQFQCSPAAFSCIRQGSVVSLQGVLTSTGIVNGTGLDVIDVSTTPADEVEGTLYSTNCNGAGSLGLILSDSSILTSGSPLAKAGFGSGICLTLSPTVTFAVDAGVLTGQALPPTGFTNSADLTSGQTIRARVTNATAGTNVINANTAALLLRFSRFTATLNTVTPPSFTITGLPANFGSIGSTIPVAVETYLNGTIVEGVSGGVTGLSNISFGQTVSVSALYLNPNLGLPQPFQAVKIRVP